MNDPTPMSTEKLVALADAYLAGELKPEELVALERALKNSSSSRALFALVTDQAAMMREVFTSKQTAEFQIEQRDTSEFLEVFASLEDHSNSAQIVDLTDELKRRKLEKHQKKAAENRWRLGLNQNDSSPSGLHQYVIPKLVAGLGLAAVIGLMVWLGLDKTPPTRDASFTDGTDSSMTETVTPPAIVATIRDSANAQWVGQDDPNDFLREGQVVTLSSGFAEIVFGSGATMIVEGPATFEMIDANAFSLTRGRIAASVPEPAKGFEVRTPAGVVTDFGTEFGVEVHDEQTTDVQVFRGEVRVARLDTNNRQAAMEHQTLLAGDAGRIDTQASRIRVGVARPSSFVRSMDQVDADRRVIFSDFESSGSRFRASDGAGWLGPWQVLERNCRVGLKTESQEPMGWDSNRYLKATMDGVPGEASSATLMRSYGNFGEVDLSQPHVIRFTYRLDSSLQGIEEEKAQISIFDGNTETLEEHTWSLHGFLNRRTDVSVPVRTWLLGNGNGLAPIETNDPAIFSRLVDTGVPIVSGMVYEVEITVRPAQAEWDIVIVYGDKRYSSAESLGHAMWFRTPNNQVHGNLHFHAFSFGNSRNRCEMSFDDVRIESIRDSDALERRQ